MKFTLNWLKEHLETSASLAEISCTLTAIGLEVEQIQNPAEALRDFIVAEIQEAAPHPNASKLQVCRVFDGHEVRQIVCGAANARAGIKVVLAREGVFIPGSGITIKKTKIRDVESNGMLCSREELGLAGESDGIIELPDGAAVGGCAADALGANDPMIEIAITPNRADCLGVRGIARDLAAAGIGALKPLSIPTLTASHPSPVTVALETPHCPLFIACTISGVKNAPSPEWLQARLSAIGLKPISALVDITNYFSFTFGRPLHVFDAAKIVGSLTVRSAKNGERLKGLNGKEYVLSEGMTVIADASRVLSIGGIMGGEDSGCTDATTDVVLEVALFDAVNIATTGRALDILSDARYRFERGVDAGFAMDGAALAVQMIQEVCGGTPSALAGAGKTPESQREIPFSPSLVESLGGVSVPGAECFRILSALGFTHRPSPAANHHLVAPPSWRADVEGSADVVEEILRIHGYDNLPTAALPKPAGTKPAALNAQQQRTKRAKRLLAARGMLEVVSWSFLSEHAAKLFGGGAPELALINPISADLSHMRPSLIPNLLSAARANANRSVHDVAMFEVGVQFENATPEGQKTVACGLRAGEVHELDYASQPLKSQARAVDVFDAKADAFALLAALGVNVENMTISNAAPAWYHPGRSGALTLGGKIVLGYFGELHPTILSAWEMDENHACAFEILPGNIPLPKQKSKAKSALKLSSFQAVERDFAFVVSADVSATTISRAITAVDKNLITEVRIFDVYAGKGMEAGTKSVAVKLTLQAPDRTLTEADLSALHERVVKAAASFGGQLRA